MELSALSLTLVGAGKMGGAMLAGWLDMGLDAANVTVIDPGLPDEMRALANAKGFSLVSSPDGLGHSDILVIAVKPQVMDAVLPSLRGLVGARTIIVSVAAGTPIAQFQAHLGSKALVVRAMPNTPAQVGRGMTAAYVSEGLEEVERQTIATLLSSTGAFTWVNSEGQIDAVTAISGSGPAYLFHMVEAMAKAGEQLGLDPHVANLLARQTVSGAGELLYQSDLEASTLRENVTSPGGTTAAALAVLMDEKDGLPPLMARATRAARDRSVELSA